MNNFEKSSLMAVRDFIDLGLDDIAYIKPVVVENEQQFAIYTADGEEATVLPDRLTAEMAVRDNDLEPVSLH
ncbi:DUF1150 domain-containing protein [Alphaproteobacteria bacterium]|nr:DUF1150 domain-containing protein [Alphaproteobacteria bacterium]